MRLPSIVVVVVVVVVFAFYLIKYTADELKVHSYIFFTMRLAVKHSISSS